jgi:hypothetical protein
MKLNIFNDFTYSISSHNHNINLDIDLPNKIYNVENLNALVSSLNKYQVCPGNPEKEFINIIKERNGQFKNIKGKLII